MAIKIIKHGKKPIEMAYHFVCGCGCEFWSDSKDVLTARTLNSYYEIKCPECGNWIKTFERPVFKSEVFDD